MEYFVGRGDLRPEALLASLVERAGQHDKPFWTIVQGIRIDAYPGDTFALLWRAWQLFNEAPQVVCGEPVRAETLDGLQALVNRLMQELPNLDWTNPKRLLEWLCELQIVTLYPTDSMIDRGLIVEHFRGNMPMLGHKLPNRVGGGYLLVSQALDQLSASDEGRITPDWRLAAYRWFKGLSDE